MYIEALLIGLVVAFLTKGRLSNLGNLEFRATFLLLIALLLQIAPIPLSGIDALSGHLHLFPFAATLIVLLFVFLNRVLRGSYLFLAGGILNSIAMALNDFKMPISRQAISFLSLDHLVEGIESGQIINYLLDDGLGTLQFILGKWIPVPSFYGYPKIISPGDILITLAIFWFVYKTSKDSLFRRSVVVRYNYNSKL